MLVDGIRHVQRIVNVAVDAIVFIVSHDFFFLAPLSFYLCCLHNKNHFDLPSTHSLNFSTIDDGPSEEYCTKLLDKNSEIPEACKAYASVKAKLDAKMDPFAGMPAGASAVRNAQIKRRMSTRHGQGKEGKKSSWF